MRPNEADIESAVKGMLNCSSSILKKLSQDASAKYGNSVPMSLSGWDREVPVIVDTRSLFHIVRRDKNFYDFGGCVSAIKRVEDKLINAILGGHYADTACINICYNSSGEILRGVWAVKPSVFANIYNKLEGRCGVRVSNASSGRVIGNLAVEDCEGDNIRIVKRHRIDCIRSKTMLLDCTDKGAIYNESTLFDNIDLFERDDGTDVGGSLFSKIDLDSVGIECPYETNPQDFFAIPNEDASNYSLVAKTPNAVRSVHGHRLVRIFRDRPIVVRNKAGSIALHIF